MITLRQQYGTDVIAPHKANRKKPKTQDSRMLERYRAQMESRAFVCLAA
jgi:hypothetical protein